MSFALHFSQHIEGLRHFYADALEQAGFDAVLLHSGSERVYFADDQHPPFKASGHFLHWLPVNRPEQMVLVIAGEKPVYFQVTPPDFWYEQNIRLEDWVADVFDVQPLEHARDVAPLLQALLSRRSIDPSRLAFLGENTGFAGELGIRTAACNPVALVSTLDYHRAYKSEYEVASIRKANRLALQGHTAARHAFENGGSEYDIHMAFLQACGMTEQEMPYPTIVALDEKAAILHYQNKRRNSGTDSRVLLIDAGCRVNGYCSDITRTWTRGDTPSLFQDLVEAMEAMQTGLIASVRPGMPYPDLHRAAHEGITRILLGAGICRGKLETLIEHKISTLFMPHGVGHLLGIQVHDVGGRMKNAQGEIQLPPEDYPALRTTRMIEKDQVFTVEPGLYFIPVLLEPERHTARGRLIDWEVVDALTPLGGIRIEDNVRVTDTGVENLTRVLI